MNIVKTIYKDEQIQAKYLAIDKVNEFPFSHGMKHINNVLKLSKQIGKLFNLTKRELEILQVCEILHDLGQVDGREKHGLKASNFAKNYLNNLNYFSSPEIEEICSAIRTHDNEDTEKFENKFSWFVWFVDKMDFSKRRLEDDYEQRFGYLEYADIEKINFAKDDTNFSIIIKTIKHPKIISVEGMFNRKFIHRVVETAEIFCKHFNLDLNFYLNKQKLNLVELSKIVPTEL